MKDGSGAGWPLYARIRITGPPEFTPADLFTDPVTGYYGITLVTGVTYTLSTESIVPGYAPDVRSLLVETAAAHTPRGIVEIIELTIDATACNAPGYALDAEGLSERFDSGTLPARVDRGQQRRRPRMDDPRGRRIHAASSTETRRAASVPLRWSTVTARARSPRTRSS